MATQPQMSLADRAANVKYMIASIILTKASIANVRSERADGKRDA